MIDPATLTTIGTLVGITKAAVDTLKGLRDLFDAKDAKRIANESQAKFEKVDEDFAAFHKRLGILALQLEQSEALTRMVPAWFEVANRMPVWKSVNDLTREDIQHLDNDLRSFLHESIRDHFSTTFFSTNFDQLPGIERLLDIFRAKLGDLDHTVSAIPPGNVDVFKGLWPTITTQFNDLRNAAGQVSSQADDVHSALIRELRESAKEVVS
jgi:hypothetical protein